MNDDHLCPKCNGTGRSFKRVDDDHRQEVVCETCGGTGSIVDALAATLSGTKTEVTVITADQWRSRFSHWW